MKKIPYETIEDKLNYILPKLQKDTTTTYSDTPCWEWTKGLTGNGGYSTFTLHRKNYIPHREMYTLYKGPIPEGLHIDHLCRNRKCCNPDHLEAVTCQENVNRGLVPLMRVSMTHCKFGHEYNSDNVYAYNTKKGQKHRRCRICNTLAAREYRKAEREKKQQRNQG